MKLQLQITVFKNCKSLCSHYIWFSITGLYVFKYRPLPLCPPRVHSCDEWAQAYPVFRHSSAFMDWIMDSISDLISDWKAESTN